MIRINFVLFLFTASQVLSDNPFIDWAKGGVMGKTYLIQRGETAAHLPVLAVRSHIKFARGETNNA
jgi:hypothetical protein